MENEKTTEFLGQMPLMSHLTELRRRLIKSFLAILVSFVVAFFFSEEIINFLKIPLLAQLPEGSKNLYFTGLIDVFMVSIKASFLVAFLAASPVCFYQFWCFLAPALYEKEKKYVKPFICASIILFFSGILFCYYYIIPITLEFFLKMGLEVGVPMITINDYFSLLLVMILAFGVIFELPVILLLLGFLNIVDYVMLAKYRKIVIILSLVVGAIMTPPDPVSQVALAIPLYLMYEISILLLRIFHRKKSLEPS